MTNAHTKIQYLVCGFDNHEVVFSGGQHPLAIIGDVNSCDGASQPWNGGVGSCQGLIAIQAYLTII